MVSLTRGVSYSVVPMSRRSEQGENQLLYERVPISALLKGRRGKHNELVLGVLRDLSTLPTDQAIRIPLNSVGDVSLMNLRSAISRAARTRKIKIRTYSDSDYFYLWKTESVRQKKTTTRGQKST
jgi:hypothetical protein